MKISSWSLALPVLLFAALPQTTFACSCMGYANPEDGYKASFDYANMVFMGTVSETSGNDEMAHSATFNVEKSWKGRPEAFVQVHTYGDSASCGFVFEEGKAYVVFAHPDSAGGVMTNICSATSEAKNQNGSALISWLNNYDAGSTSSSSSLSEESCKPYICANGDEHPSCTEDGHVINYFVAPCQFSGGDASAGSSSSTAQVIFSDVPSSHTNASAIAFVKEKGIVSGYGDGTFGPEKLINRAEFTKIVIGATFAPEVIAACKAAPLFSDVASTDWFRPYVCHAKQAAVIGGYPDGTFKPAQNVNFAEAAKIVVNAFDITINEEEALGVWWRPYVYALARVGGLPATFSDPNQLVTRGEMAEMISRIMQGMKQ